MSNNEFFESRNSAESGETKSIMELVAAIRDALKKMTRQRRYHAWRAVTSKDGQREMQNLLRNPERPISTFRRLRDFREWLKTEN